MENHLGGKKSEANYADLEMMWTKANIYLKKTKALVNEQKNEICLWKPHIKFGFCSKAV